MRKLSIFLSTLIAIAMLLTACGGEETSTNVPGTDLPTTELPSETAEATATGDMTTTETTVPGDMTSTPVIPVTGENNVARLSNQLNFDVWNQNDEQVGEVNDMVLDLDNARVAYVIVGPGGFLEIGEKDVLIPWDQLEIRTVDNGQDNAFVLLADSEFLNNAPDTDINSVLPGMGLPAGDWDADIRNFWETGVLPNTPDPNMTATPEMTATVNPGQGQDMKLQGVMLASDALGSNITVGAQGQGVDPNPVNATIEDMIVDIETGDVLYLVLDTDLPDGERWIPVPLGFLQWDAANAAFVLRVDGAALQNAPFFEADQYPDTTVDGWDADWADFWNNIEIGVMPTSTP